MQKIVTFLWFEDRAEEAMEFYVSLFPDSKVINVDRIPGGGVVGAFQMAGQEYRALQGGPMFKFTEAISRSMSSAMTRPRLTASGRSCSKAAVRSSSAAG